MFQRLKGAIDSRIAEEQSRQRLSQASPSRSASNTGRSSSRNLSPSKRVLRQARGRQDGESSAKGPDPAEFESEFVVDDNEHTRSGTPKPTADPDGGTAKAQKIRETGGGEDGQENGETNTSVEEPETTSDLPTDVRVKLRKLEKLESRYHELLRSYRVAHARVLTIEPFETTLRENTPLTSINDPKALVEYLNQVNLKGDMVLDELKKVSNERDVLRQKVSDAEQSTKEAWDEVANPRKLNDLNGKLDESSEKSSESRLDNDNAAQDTLSGDSLSKLDKFLPTSAKSPTMSARGLNMFSPKSRPADSPKLRQGSVDLFSYDDEIPRLETELKDRQTKIEGLENEVKSLKGDLAVTQESTQSMVQSLEETNRELNGLRDSKDRSVSDLREQALESEKVLEQFRVDLLAAESRLQESHREHGLQESSRITELHAQLKAARLELENTQSAAREDKNASMQVDELGATITTLQAEISDLQAGSEKSEKKMDTLNKVIATLRAQLQEADEKNQDLKLVIEKSSKASTSLQEKLDRLESQTGTGDPKQPEGHLARIAEQKSDLMKQNTTPESTNAHDASNVNKKKKKRKKVVKTSAEHDHGSKSNPNTEPEYKASEATSLPESQTLSRLQEELRQVRILLDEKDAAIKRMHAKLKDQDGLHEEIDTLRDDLISVGQEHVEAKDKVKELSAEKATLEITVADLTKQLAELQDVHNSSAAGSEQRYNNLAVQFEDLKHKAMTLQTDLSAAQQLASTRFKDLNELRNILQKAQPEINSLRNEAAEVKSVKEALAKKDIEFNKLDSRHNEIGSEVTGLKKIIMDRESEIKSINQKLGLESSNRIKAEEASSKSTQEIQRLDTEKRRATESCDRLTKELEKVREELLSNKTRLKEIEQQSSKARSDNEGFKEEIDLKTAQYASAQSLMASMRDQITEMAMQTKEARERCESLDEEVADAHRLLSERSREGETMRRLLADVEGRADARTREMKERLDTAIEERDRAEDEASTAGRRRTRELEDLRNKYRDIERDLKRVERDKEELEIAQRDWRRRREELENQAVQSTREVDEVRRAMGDLRDALDESEKQVRDLEKQKAELRRSVEETQHRLEKLQKSNKSMADEIGKIQTARTKSVDSSAPSSRSTPDSTPRLGSPVSKSRAPSAALMDAPNGQVPGAMDFVYLKNVLLQFLEQKDKKHQMQLVPVLGMLLNFDKKDEQKWMSAITTKA